MKTQLKLKVVVWATTAAIAAVLLLWPSSSRAGVEEEIAKLRKELAEIKKDIAEIKSILILQGRSRARRPSRVTAEVSVSGKPSRFSSCGGFHSQPGTDSGGSPDSIRVLLQSQQGYGSSWKG